jgi:hypothetical protein
LELNLSNLQHIRADAGTQFTSAAFIQSCNNKSIKVSVAAPKHQEQNGLCERTWQSLRNLAFSFMNYARVGEEFGDLALEHAWKVFATLPLKNLRKNGCVTTPFELYYNRKPSIRKFRVLFCPCVYKVYFREKTTSKITRRFDSSNHPQRGVIGVFCGFPRGQAGYLIWEPRSKTLRVSGDVQFDETFVSTGPRRHFAFRDALPVSTATTVPDLDNFRNSVPDDDHFGLAYVRYHEDGCCNGWFPSSFFLFL